MIAETRLKQWHDFGLCNPNRRAYPSDKVLAGRLVFTLSLLKDLCNFLESQNTPNLHPVAKNPDPSLSRRALEVSKILHLDFDPGAPLDSKVGGVREIAAVPAGPNSESVGQFSAGIHSSITKT